MDFPGSEKTVVPASLARCRVRPLAYFARITTPLRSNASESYLGHNLSNVLNNFRATTAFTMRISSAFKFQQSLYKTLSPSRLSTPFAKQLFGTPFFFFFGCDHTPQVRSRSSTLFVALLLSGHFYEIIAYVERLPMRWLHAVFLDVTANVTEMHVAGARVARVRK